MKYSPEFEKAIKSNLLGSLAETEDWLDAVRPAWAVGLNKFGELKEGTQLLTKDGRFSGNAQITVEFSKDLFRVKTERGNVMTLTEKEILDHYHIGIYYVHEYFPD